MSDVVFGIQLESGVHVEQLGDNAALIEIRRPPHNFFNQAVLRDLADVLLMLDEVPQVRAVMLCSEGKNFCAGADFTPGGADTEGGEDLETAYAHVSRILRARKPLVAAIQGAAIGGGLGLACVADFRVGSPESRFSASFVTLGFHAGFGLTVSLPRLIGDQAALRLLFLGERIGGNEALELGLLDYLVSKDDIRLRAHALVQELAEAAPLALMSIKETMRAPHLTLMNAALARENAEQARLRETRDFAEGIAANAARRSPIFLGE